VACAGNDVAAYAPLKTLTVTEFFAENVFADKSLLLLHPFVGDLNFDTFDILMVLFYPLLRKTFVTLFQHFFTKTTSKCRGKTA
jgi:hypothetical protein